MSNQSNERFTKRTFEYKSDLLDELKLMSTLEKKSQKDLINGFLEDGLREWRKSRGQSTLDWLKDIASAKRKIKLKNKIES